jgi:outer membrane protein assembly factor BamD (BamD/ComL family)
LPAAPASRGAVHDAHAEAIPFESLPFALAPRTTPGKKADPQSHSDLALEVESLDRVRKALAASDPSGALRELGAFSARFPYAALAPEATVLRVQALLESGNRQAAERLARRFIAASPGSPHAARVRLLIDGSARPKARFD